MGSIIITPADPGYPAILTELAPGGTPPSLYLRGALPTARGVAVVGTRRPTLEAVAFTQALVRDLAAEGLAIWSGGALGIDAVAHEAAPLAGAPTAVSCVGTKPVLPGVALLSFVMRALQARPELQARLGPAPQIAQVKFISPVLPDTDLQVQLQAQGSGVAFEVRREGQVVTKGQLKPGAAA